MPSEVDWRHGADHMWDRHMVTTGEANEALSDVDAVWFEPDPKSRLARASESSATAPAAVKS